MFSSLKFMKEILQQNGALKPSILVFMEGGEDSLALRFFFPLLWMKGKSLHGPKWVLFLSEIPNTIRPVG